MKEAAASKERPMFTTALIAGDSVILDAIAKADLFGKIPIVFVDTYTLFPETMSHLREVESHYGFKAQVYAAKGCSDQEDYYAQYGRDYWMKDIDEYDMLCKVEPMNRALSEQVSLSFRRWSGRNYYSILSVSCFIWSVALDSSDLLLSYSIISLAFHISIILISTLFLTHIYICAELRLLDQRPQEGPRR